MNRQFPRLEVDAGRIRSNAQQIAARCRARGIAVCGKSSVHIRRPASLSSARAASNRSFAAARPGSKGRIC